MNDFKSVIRIIGMISIPMVIGNLAYYIIGAFVAWNLNPLEWFLLKDTLGRFLLVILEFVLLVNVPKFWEEFEL
jgi:hypothetical protein